MKGQRQHSDILFVESNITAGERAVDRIMLHALEAA